MKMQKYVDMAYGNPRGTEWLNLIHHRETWTKWCRKVLEHTSVGWLSDSDRPEKILTAAIWHFGYAHDSCKGPELRKTARRLRRGEAPRDRGEGALKWGPDISSAELSVYGMPLEFYLLDNFLEREVRPMMDTLTKTTE